MKTEQMFALVYFIVSVINLMVSAIFLHWSSKL